MLKYISSSTLTGRRIAFRGKNQVQLAGIALLAVVAVWGAGFVVVRAAVAAYPVVGFLFLRFLVGGTALVVLADARPGARPNWGSVPRLPLAAVGASLAVGYITQTLGLALGAPAGVAATLTGLVVVLTPAWEWVMSGRAPQRRVVLSALLAVSGTLVICQSAPTSVGTHPEIALAIGLELISAVAFALQVVLVGRLGQHLSATALGGAQLVMVALLLAPFVPFTGGLPALSGVELAAVAFSALGASAFAFAVQAAAQRHLTPATAAVIMALEPGFALVFAAAAGEEPLGLLALAGLGLLLLGVVAQGTGVWGRRLRRLLWVAATGGLVLRHSQA